MSSDVKRLHWACGWAVAPGWINSDIMTAPGIDVAVDLRKGLPIESNSIDYAASHHGLNDLKIYEQLPALTELRRVLKPGGVLRLSLPDLDRFIAAYQRGDASAFYVHDWDTVDGNFITHVLWYNNTQTPFTFRFAAELLTKAGFRDVRRCGFKKSCSPFPDIVELDSREEESFFIEGVK